MTPDEREELIEHFLGALNDAEKMTNERSEAYCVDSGRPVQWEAGDRCIKHGNRDTPCYAALRDPRCSHPRGGSNGSDRCQECGAKLRAGGTDA